MVSLKGNLKESVLIVVSHLSTKNLGIKIMPTTKFFSSKTITCIGAKSLFLLICGAEESNLGPCACQTNTSPLSPKQH